MGRTGYEPLLMREVEKGGTVRRPVVGEGVGAVRILGMVRGVVEELRFSSIIAVADGRSRRPKTRLTTAQEYLAGLRRGNVLGRLLSGRETARCR